MRADQTGAEKARERPSRVAGRAGNRQTHRQGWRVQSLASPLGNRAHILLAATQSPFDGPLRSPRHDRLRFCEALDDSCHAEAADAGDPLKYRANFRFRLLGPVLIPPCFGHSRAAAADACGARVDVSVPHIELRSPCAWSCRTTSRPYPKGCCNPFHPGACRIGQDKRRWSTPSCPFG